MKTQGAVEVLPDVELGKFEMAGLSLEIGKGDGPASAGFG